MSSEEKTNRVNIDLLASKRIDRTANPNDILETIASLSNDEVATPPAVAIKMLNELETHYNETKENDALPLFSNPNITYLDPACKSGVFLKEISRRLFIGLADLFPDEQERRNHILHNQLYGIAITELTALASRRTLYGSAHPNGKFSYSKMPTSEGNIRYANWQLIDSTKPTKEELAEVRKEIETALLQDKDEKGLPTTWRIVFQNQDKKINEIEELVNRIRGTGTKGFLANVKLYDLKFMLDGTIKSGLSDKVYLNHFIAPLKGLTQRHNFSELATKEINRRLEIANEKTREAQGQETELFSQYTASDIIEEQHNYPFYIWEKDKLQEYLKREFGKMEFDVIIGNPPYQEQDSEETSGATPLYHKFVNNAIALSPSYITMITPSRWLTSPRRDLATYRSKMLQDKHIARLVDYWDSKECFPEVSIEGGVSYFLWDKNHTYKDCLVKTIVKSETISEVRRNLNDSDVFVRASQAAEILTIVQNRQLQQGRGWMNSQVLTSKPFGLRTNFSDFKLQKSGIYQIGFFTSKVRNSMGYIPLNAITKNASLVSKYKVFTSATNGAAMKNKAIISPPSIAKPNEVVSEAYTVLGFFDTDKEAQLFAKYVRTKFFRTMLWTRKQTQRTTQADFAFVPKLDFSVEWNDLALYEEFGLNDKQIEFIEGFIAPMEEK